MSPKFKRARKRKKRVPLDQFTVGPVTMKRVGKRILLRNRAKPEQFVAMRKALAQWKLEAPAAMRAEAEAMLSLVADVHPLIAIGFIFFVNHLSPLLAGKEMAESYVLVEHLALMLAKELRTGTTMVMDQPTGQGLIELLASQLRDAIQYGLPDLPADGSLPPNDYRDALATILMWELAVRVPRYDHQEKALLHSLFTDFSAELKAALGFTCDDAMILEECMTQRIQTMALEGRDIALHVMDDVDRVLRGQPASNPENEAFIAQVRQANPGKNIKHELSGMLGAWMAFRTAFSFAATLDELVADSGLDRAIVEHILAALLVAPADLADYWYMVPASPLKKKPVLKIDRHYVMPSPGLFLPALQKLFEDTLKPTTTWEPYQQHRSRFAEDRAAELFLRVFPGAIAYKNLKYKNKTQEGEVDVMVMFDRQLFLIEVKSGAFAEAARHGVISRVGDTLRDLVLKAHEQVQLASAYIVSADVTTFKDGATRIEVRKGDFDEVHLVSVTLEQIGHIVNGLGPLLRRGNLPRAPWSVSLDDLETITDVLLRPATFLHYIMRRQVLLLQPNIESGDELGFLERYLTTSLLEEQNGFSAYDNVMMDPSSKTIDAFEQAKVADADTQPPEQKLVPEVLMLVDKLAESRPPGWMGASLILLNLPSRLQKALAATIKLVDRGVRVPGVVLRGAADGDMVLLRIDDPKKATTPADGVSLHLDRQWNVNAVVSPQLAGGERR